MSMKKILIISSISVWFGIGCINYYVRDAAPVEKEKLPAKYNPKRVALVGFRPFATIFKGQTGNTLHYEAIVNYDLDYRKNLKDVGVPVESIPARGTDPSIPKERVEVFTKLYLDSVKWTGIPELKQVFETREIKKGDPTNLAYTLKKRDVDYYVVGIPGPPFLSGGDFYILKFLGTAHISLGTLFTIPWWMDNRVESTIYVFDSKLNLIKTWKRESVYNGTLAWWNKNTGEGTLQLMDIKNEKKERFYLPDLADFSNEFIGFVSKADPKKNPTW
uniref:Lipoprotein n=2 Tax=Leptospira ellisii TaxID=2023197 RepID=A0A2N0B8M3_9LEPT|nr:hypothetical protein CH379_10650 [Leptospira ellisii]